ncbi:MAG: glycosyltransferase [Thermoflavifilum sp.]|nr:glycosyltransferase [Thermoflavifilum sp.]
MAHRKKILWLVSWYPDRMQPTNGDFIERHALAASRVADIVVVHLTKDPTLSAARLEVDDSSAPSLVVYRWYDVPSTFQHPLFRKIHHAWKYAWAAYRVLTIVFKQQGKPDLVHAHVSWKAGLLALCLKYLKGYHYILSEHASYFQPGSSQGYAHDDQLRKWLIRQILRHASLWLPVSVDLGNQLQAIAGTKDFLVVPNAVDTHLFFYSHKAHRQVRRFIHVSNMQPHKCPSMILQAFAAAIDQLHDWQMVMVGPVESRLKELVDRNGSLKDRVIFTGWLSHAQLANYLREADCLILYSLYENQPCAILEALCCGLPVIAAAVGGVPEIISNDKGILVPPADVESLQEAMCQMAIKIRDFDRETIAKQACQKYAYETIAIRFQEVYAL